MSSTLPCAHNLALFVTTATRFKPQHHRQAFPARFARSTHVTCTSVSSQREDSTGEASFPTTRRREVLIAAASVPAFSLGGDIDEAALAASDKPPMAKGVLLAVTVEELKKDVKAEDVSKVLRLLVADAGTYNADDGTGGVNGSIHFGEELARQENEGLSEIVERLASAKARVDVRVPVPITWADLIVVACKVAVQKSWLQVKIDRAPDVGSGKTIAEQFGTAWTINLGRRDATDASPPDPTGRLCSSNASIGEMKTFFDSLGVPSGSGGPFAPKPPIGARQQFLLMPYLLEGTPEEVEAQMAIEYTDEYSGWKKKYDKNRITITRTDYEVDCIDAIARVARLGIEYDPNLYNL